ncbi:hypothetical protein KSP39_PZI013989 [Platanthera zijinensis]|uniref:Aminoacyl-tRNA synthetase class II (G/ P/ S/T) domain-containing protein n=1 Tax=Platanthera zijinensis TaxID=2320716 RepID=A0AAP0BBN1_9ASPA
MQDDAHIFCLEDQIREEIKGVLELTEEILLQFGFRKYEVNLSTRPQNFIGSDEIWEKATAAIRDALDDKGWDYQVDEGGGAFYGPKIDLKIEDALGRKWQCSTVQATQSHPPLLKYPWTSPKSLIQTIPPKTFYVDSTLQPDSPISLSSSWTPLSNNNPNSHLYYLLRLLQQEIPANNLHSRRMHVSMIYIKI